MLEKVLWGTRSWPLREWKSKNNERTLREKKPLRGWGGGGKRRGEEDGKFLIVTSISPVRSSTSLSSILWSNMVVSSLDQNIEHSLKNTPVFRGETFNFLWLMMSLLTLVVRPGDAPFSTKCSHSSTCPSLAAKCNGLMPVCETHKRKTKDFKT